jgi:hypothetical protein
MIATLPLALLFVLLLLFANGRGLSRAART